MLFFDSILGIIGAKILNTPNVYHFLTTNARPNVAKEDCGQVTFSYEKFEKIIERLFSSGFYNVNGAISQLADYTGYKAWYQIEEFENANGHRVVLEFIKEFVNGRVYYHIKNVEVA